MTRPNEFCFKHQTWRFAGEQCVQCAAETLDDRLEAHRECMHTHSRRIDQAHDAAMSVADQLADLSDAVERLRRLLAAQQARLTEAETTIRQLREQVPMGNSASAPAVTWIRPRP